MRAQWDEDLSTLCGGSSDPDAGKLANRIEGHILALEKERDMLRARMPRAYAMERKAEWLRLFREVRGFLNACRKEHHGTDFSGRMHAIDALDAAVAFLNEPTNATPA